MVSNILSNCNTCPCAYECSKGVNGKWIISGILRDKTMDDRLEYLCTSFLIINKKYLKIKFL